MTAPTHHSEAMIRRPVAFEANAGQFEAGGRYRAEAAGMSLALTAAAP